MVSFSLVTDRDDSLRAFEMLAASFSRSAAVFHQHGMGWQGGSGGFDVYWHLDYAVWGVFQRDPPRQKEQARFWSCFGVDDPEKEAMLHITVEINPPHVGENARLAGVFLRDQSGQIFLGHTGRVGGGRPGIGGRPFRSFFKDGDWHEIDGSRRKRREVIVFGPLGRDDLAAVIAPYVHAVARFKSVTSHSS